LPGVPTVRLIARTLIGERDEGIEEIEKEVVKAEMRETLREVLRAAVLGFEEVLK
jgi:hypothetical protein